MGERPELAWYLGFKRLSGKLEPELLEGDSADK